MRYKEKNGYLLAATLSVAALLFTAVILAVLPDKKMNTPNSSISAPHAQEQKESPAAEEKEAEGKYIMKMYNGNVAVYDASAQDSPLYVTGIDGRTLRDADREAFEKGVVVGSDEELASMLEDYGS
ncbi:MAG: hypothetical protein Q8878_03015 [Bacillota bacterium]|nr:hypothetical protein [Bacillota bacterium]